MDDDGPPNAVRRARAAVAAVFFTNGALFATAVPRFPEIKGGLDLSNTAWGSAIAAFPLGALVAGLSAGALIRRAGSARVAALGIVVLAAMLPLVAVAGNWFALATLLAVAGAMDAIIDVAQNTHGLRVQRLYGRSIVNAFHGVWSVGGVAGGLLGSAAAGWSVPLRAHLGCGAVLFTAVALVAYRHLLPGHDDVARADAAAVPHGSVNSPLQSARGRRRARGTVLALAALGVLVACGAVVEDAAASWSALFMSSSEVGATAALAGLAFVVFQVTMTVGRLLGDGAIDRFGSATVVRAGGALTAAGMSIGLLAPAAVTVLVAYGLAGLGAATVVPAAMHAADELPGLPAGTGLTIVSWLLQIGFLVTPPIVGVVADATNLRVGLGVVVVAGLLVTAVGRALVPRATAPARA